MPCLTFLQLRNKFINNILQCFIWPVNKKLNTWPISSLHLSQKKIVETKLSLAHARITRKKHENNLGKKLPTKHRGKKHQRGRLGKQKPKRGRQILDSKPHLAEWIRFYGIGSKAKFFKILQVCCLQAHCICKWRGIGKESARERIAKHTMHRNCRYSFRFSRPSVYLSFSRLVFSYLF